MAEDEIIQEEPQIEESPQEKQPEGPGPKYVLSEENRQKLADALLKMKAAKASPEKLKMVADAFGQKYGQEEAAAAPAANTLPPQPDYAQVPRQSGPSEGRSPSQQTADRLDINNDPNNIARRERYTGMRKQAIAEVESPDWQTKIFIGKKPALTDEGDIPDIAFQKVDPAKLDEYLATKDMNPKDKYWLRNQLLNYGKFRQAKYYIEKEATKRIDQLPEEDRKNPLVLDKVFLEAEKQYDVRQTANIANRLNNIGIDNRPLRGDAPFHDQITGANKALMGTVNYAGDLGQQVSSLLELGNVPGLSDLGYHIKTTADNLKAKNEIPQNGELGNKLAGEILPMALDMEALRRLSSAAGKPLYSALAGARAEGRIGKFAEGALGGIAVSPANSYIISHQYYNELVKQGMDPSKAASRADQLLSKNMATDMLMTPLQMGLMKMPAGSWIGKGLTALAEGATSGVHFSLQDFNQKSTENPAMHILDYISNGEYKEPFVTGMALGMVQKAAVDALHNWDVKSETKDMFSYGRKYGTDVRTSLPSNQTIAGNVLSALEMKPVPGRAQELKDLTQSLLDSGVYRQHEADRVNAIIDDVAAVKDQVPKFGTTQQKMAIFNELLNIRSTDEFLTKAGNEAGEKFLKGINKESEARIQRILSGEEPLYFVNGNETNKVQLLEALEKNPELLTSKGVRIDVRNDPPTQNKIKELKEQQDAIQKQGAAAPDVRPSSGDSAEMGTGDESQGTVDQETSGKEGGPIEGDQLELRFEDPPDAEQIVHDIEHGHIKDEELTKAIKSSIDEANESLQRLREGDSTETGSDKADERTGQGSEEPRAPSGIPEAEQGKDAAVENTSTESIPGSTGTSDETGVTQEAGLPNLYTKEFYDHDVKPFLQKVGANIKDAWGIMRRALDPRHGVSEKALTHIMKALGDRNQSETMMDAALKGIEKMFHKMSDSQRIDFINRMKRGQGQGDKTMDNIAKMIRELDESLYNELKKYKPNLDWKENHFRVLWKVLPGAQPGAKEKFYEGRRPLEGTKGFMKRATLADISEGIKRGGVPVSTNPITMFKLAYADGMKYITAQRMWEALKKDKFVKYVRRGQDPPEGFVRLDDRLARVYFKTSAEDTLKPNNSLVPKTQGKVIPIPEGKAVYRGKLHEVVHKPGVLTETGEYWIDKGAGRLLNNYLSRDLIREKVIGRGLMAIKNAFTAAELSFSGFHAVAEGAEAINSQIGMGIRKMVNLGNFAGGVKDILTSPLAFKTTASVGARAIKFATSEAFRKSQMGQEFLKKMPGADQYVDDFFQGGGLMKQHEDLRTKTMELFKDQFNKDNYIGAVVRALPAFNDLLMNPLFGVYIPRLKVGMFFKEFPVTMKENAGRLAAGQVTRQELARKTIDFIDDRLGEMNFDNLFWNRTLKTSMQFFLRSVTWKLGSLRATWGILPEQSKEIYKAVKEGRKPNLSPKAAWALGLAVMQVAVATLIQHMLAHKDIETFKDVVAPQINKDDPDERVVLPTYLKDVVHQYHSATSKDKLGYITSSTAGQISRLLDIWNNKDFYGYEIRDQHAGVGKQLWQSMLYVAPKPFSASSMYAMNEKGEPWSKQMMSIAGLQKAPAWLTNTDRENEIFELYSQRNAGTKPYKEKEAAKVKKEIKLLFKDGKNDDAREKLDKAIKDETIRPSQVKSILKNSGHSMDASVYFFSRLPFEDKEALYKDMTAEERDIYDPKGKFAKELEKIKNAKEQE